MTVHEPSKDQYLELLKYCEETTAHIRSLQEMTRKTMCQGLSIEITKYSDDIVNWIEEIEFTINDKHL